MKVKIIGVQKVDFVDKNGEAVKGVKLHYSCPPTIRQSSSFRGDRVATLFVRYGISLYDIADSLKVNSTYDFIYDFDGKYSVLVDIKPSA